MTSPADSIVVITAAAAALNFLITHLRVSRLRASNPGGESGRRTAPLSTVGLVIEVAAFTLLLNWRSPGPIPQPFWHWLAAALAVASTVVVWIAIRHLGAQWRVQAVVTEGHKLVTSGPYSVVRHPIYAAMLGYLLSFGLAFSNWIPLAVSTTVYIVGTELRVRAEDGLLRSRFGSEFENYRQRVRAYIPFVR